jgi:hypothetical protein
LIGSATLGDLDVNHLARLVSFLARYDCLDMDLTAWLLFGIVALLIILAILALFAGSCPSDISIGEASDISIGDLQVNAA